MTDRAKLYPALLDTLITSRTRIKLMMKFFLNSTTRSYLRDLEGEFGESTNAIRVELNRFEEAGLLQSEQQGNKKIFKANTRHPLFGDIHSILLKYTGIDQVVEKVVNNLGGVSQAWLIGDFARGSDSKVIDIMLVGEDIDRPYLLNLVEKTENLISRKIRYMLLEPKELPIHVEEHPEALLLWEFNPS